MSAPLQINIGEILEAKTGKKLPRPLVYLLERLIHQKSLNTFLKDNNNKEGLALLDAFLEKQNIELNWINEKKLPQNGRCIFVCNHPLGAIDGIGIASLLSHKYSDVRYLVNDILCNVTPLRKIFLPINTLGSQKKENISKLKEAMLSNLPICSFPAGYCSRIIDGKIRDRAWQKSFVTQAIEYDRDIVPLYFDGRNSRHFYIIESIRKQLKIKIDLGSALLPDEMFRAKNKTFNVIVGDRISHKRLKDCGRKPIEIAQDIRKSVYKLHTEYIYTQTNTIG